MILSICGGGRPSHCQTIRGEAHQSAGHNRAPEHMAGRHMGCEREVGDLFVEGKDQGCTGYNEGLCFAFFSRKRSFEIVSRLDVDWQKVDPEFVCRQPALST
jgi:hypothetical protein